MKKFQEWIEEREVNEQGEIPAAAAPPIGAPGVSAPPMGAPGAPAAPVRTVQMGKGQIAKGRREEAIGQNTMILQSVHALQSALPLIGKDKKAQAQLMPIINKIMNALRNIEDPDLKVKATEIMTTLGGMGKAAGRLKKWDVGAGQATPAAPPAAPAAPMGAPGAPMAGTPMPGQMVAHRKPEGLVVTEGLINYIQKYNLS